MPSFIQLVVVQVSYGLIGMSGCRYEVYEAVCLHMQVYTLPAACVTQSHTHTAIHTYRGAAQLEVSNAYLMPALNCNPWNFVALTA